MGLFCSQWCSQLDGIMKKRRTTSKLLLHLISLTKLLKLGLSVQTGKHINTGFGMELIKVQTVHDIRTHDEWIVNVFTTTVISERQILYHCVELRAVWVVVLKVFDSFLNSCNASKILVQSARRSEAENEN